MKNQRLNAEIAAADALTAILSSTLLKMEEFTDTIEAKNEERSVKALAKAEELNEKQQALWDAYSEYHSTLHHPDLRK